jgi:hypothetical protein
MRKNHPGGGFEGIRDHGIGAPGFQQAAQFQVVAGGLERGPQARGGVGCGEAERRIIATDADGPMMNAI